MQWVQHFLVNYILVGNSINPISHGFVPKTCTIVHNNDNLYAPMYTLDKKVII